MVVTIPNPVDDTGPSSPPVIDILGVGVSATSMESAIKTISGWMARGEHQYVVVRDVHGIMACRKDPELHEIHRRAGLVTPDGMPIVWVSRALGYPNVGRVAGPDLMLEMLRLSSSHGTRHYFYGGVPGVATKLADCMRQRFPGVNIVGTYSPRFGPMTEQEDRDIVDTINASGADIVWVGLGTPKQERWMAQHVGQLNAAALIGVGAAFDFHAGRLRRAPEWMQHAGVEGIFRFLHEPRRLWRRYLVMAPLFAMRAGREVAKFRLRRMA
jgi:N-acetylglucosaminyldiphosphoundecaprenol N-acetyl-beta-D-mannosaminyltransferase